MPSCPGDDGSSLRLPRYEIDRDDGGICREDVLAIIGRYRSSTEGPICFHLGNFEATRSLWLNEIRPELN